MSGSKPGDWHDLWTRWRYSDVIELLLVKLDRWEEDIDTISNLDIEFAEQLNTHLLIKILQRL